MSEKETNQDGDLGQKLTKKSRSSSVSFLCLMFLLNKDFKMSEAFHK